MVLKIDLSSDAQFIICSFLLPASHKASSFDVAVLGALNPPSHTHTTETLAELAKILKFP